VARLARAFDAQPIDIAVARTFAQPHPVFALVRRTLLPHLSRFLAAGGRKIDAWYASLPMAEVAFDDEADAFRNINTPAELAASATAH
jgi:molybdopterin-guanine dinucleotide biosynthesis protein A